MPITQIPQFVNMSEPFKNKFLGAQDPWYLITP